jgi:antitoxin Xre/MbcA/ParS-like protein
VTPIAQELIAEAPPTTEPRALLERAPAALRTFFRIAAAWELTRAEERLLLGSPVESTFYRWRNGESTGGATPDTMERLSHVFGIYGALHRIFMDTARADQWLRRPNEAPLFGGGTPLARLSRGRMADLLDVRRFLEYVAEGGL